MRYISTNSLAPINPNDLTRCGGISELREIDMQHVSNIVEKGKVDPKHDMGRIVCMMKTGMYHCFIAFSKDHICVCLC